MTPSQGLINPKTTDIEICPIRNKQDKFLIKIGLAAKKAIPREQDTVNYDAGMDFFGWGSSKKAYP